MSKVFLIYLAILVVFAYWYYRLYRKNANNFLFGEKIESAQRERSVRVEQATITRLEEALIALQAFNSLFVSGSSVEPNVVKPKYVLEVDSEPYNLQLTRIKDRKYTIAYHLKIFRSNRLLRLYSTNQELFLTAKCKLDLNTIKVLTQKQLVEVGQEIELHRQDLASEGVRYWSFWDFLYFSGITLTTVGFGDILPNNTRVRQIVLLEVLCGVVLLVVVLNTIIGSSSTPCPAK
jgi:hypothetical protein